MCAGGWLEAIPGGEFKKKYVVLIRFAFGDSVDFCRHYAKNDCFCKVAKI